MLALLLTSMDTFYPITDLDLSKKKLSKCTKNAINLFVEELWIKIYKKSDI